eukprot:CAMPEP_0177774028 /NCGR_PEP_ID=MMETSP0491_2-20121128/13248_1 /TAXON_ID=63592 /ORGANISM="Tetraselmis chuii, Strain PLY429" /LENGTH=61 /DNA_ID=CAMNT_0019292299 /DNA_START=346 /DNA_END=531 /DNA_ORIENTATION=-
MRKMHQNTSPGCCSGLTTGQSGSRAFAKALRWANKNQQLGYMAWSAHSSLPSAAASPHLSS